MFSDLRAIAAQTPPKPARPAVASLSSTRLALAIGRKLADARVALTTNGAEMQSVIEDYVDLRRLRAVISAHGINKAMMSLVEHKNRGISRLVPGMPSLESLDAIGTEVTDPRTRAAIEGIDDVLDLEPGQVGDWIQMQASQLLALLTATGDQIHGLDEVVDYYVASFSDCDDGAMPELADSILMAVPHDCALSRIEALLSALPEFDATIFDPTDGDAMAMFVAKLQVLAETLGEHTGLKLSDSPHLLVCGAPSEMCDPKSASFGELGYTVANLNELLQKTDMLVDALGALVDRKEALVEQLTAAAQLVGVVDNDVPPMVDDAISGAGESLLDGGRTSQVDVVYFHVSSCLNCITAMTDAAVKAVEGVLVVAEHAAAACPPDADSDATD